jgi:hypothetical protein
MNQKIVLTVAILGFAAWWAWKKYVLLQNVIIEIGSVSIDGGLLNPNFRVNLLIKNPTGLEAYLTELDGLIVDKQKNKIAKLTINGIFKVDPYSFILVPLDVKLDSFKVLNSISEFFYNKEQEFKISGYATVDGIPIPYQFNVVV